MTLLHQSLCSLSIPGYEMNMGLTPEFESYKIFEYNFSLHLYHEAQQRENHHGGGFT